MTDLPTAPGVSRVLVVDPDADLGALTATWLRMTGFDVRVAADGAQAVRLLSDLTFDALVVDLPLLPGVDTAEVLARTRATQPGCRTVVTSVLDVADYPAADAALPKPFSRVQLIGAVVAPTDLPTSRPSTDRSARV